MRLKRLSAVTTAVATLAILRELGYSTRYLDAMEYDDEVPEL